MSMTLAPHHTEMHHLVDKLTPAEAQALYVLLKSRACGSAEPAGSMLAHEPVRRLPFAGMMHAGPDYAEHSKAVIRDELGRPWLTVIIADAGGYVAPNGSVYWLADEAVDPDAWPIVGKLDLTPDEQWHRFDMTVSEFVYRTLADPEFQPFNVDRWLGGRTSNV